MPLMEAVVSRIQEKLGNLGPVTSRLTDLLSFAVAQVEAENTDRCRAGRCLGGMFSTVGVAPVQAIPTTTASFALFNGDPLKSYILDELDVALLSGTAGIGMTLLGIVSPITSSKPVAATGAAVGSLSGSAYGTKAVLATAYALPALASGVQWSSLLCVSQPGGVPGVGGGFSFQAKGKFIVPPGQVGGFAMLAPAGTTPLFLAFPKWSEFIKDLE